MRLSRARAPLAGNRRTRRTTAGLVVALLLAACNNTPNSPVPSEGAGEGFPVSVEHEFGTTKVPRAPVRVVSVGYTEHDTLLALGVTPVGLTDWYGDQPYATWPWAQAALGDAKPAVLNLEDGFQFEKIAALKPDLIVGTNSGMEEADFQKLSGIAPTIAQAKGAVPFFSRWDAQTLAIGKALGMEAQAEDLVKDVKDQFAAAAQAHPEFAGKKVIFLQNAIYGGSAIAYQKGLSTDFITSLSFDIPGVLDEFSKSEEEQAMIPLEQLSVLNEADVLLWATESPQDRRNLESEPIYMSLEEVKSGHLVFTDAVTAGAIYFTSPLSLPYLLDKLVTAFAGALAGEGPVTTTP